MRNLFTSAHRRAGRPGVSLVRTKSIAGGAAVATSNPIELAAEISRIKIKRNTPAAIAREAARDRLEFARDVLGATRPHVAYSLAGPAFCVRS